MSTSEPQFGPLPPEVVQLKEEIAAAFPDFEQRVTAAWTDLLKELKASTDEIIARGTNVSLMFIW